MQAWVELIIFLPFVLIPGYFVYEGPRLFIWLVLLPFFYVFGFMITGWIHRKSRLFLTIVLIDLLAALTVFPDIAAMIVAFSAFLTFSVRGYLYKQMERARLFPNKYFWFGLTMYFVSFLIIFYYDRSHELITYITYCGFLAIVLTLFVNNQKILANNASSGKSMKAKLSPQMIKQNRLFIFIFLVVTFGISSIRMIEEALRALHSKLSAMLNHFFHKDREIIDEVFDEVGTEVALGASKEPSAWVSFLEKALLGIVIVLGVIIGLLLLYFSIKGSIRLFKFVRSWIMKKMGQADDMEDEGLGYVDEKESLLDMKKLLQDAMKKAKFWTGNEEKWIHQQTNEAKIRFLYRFQLYQAIRKGYVFKPELTPVETIEDIKQWNKDSQIAELLSAAYNRTRYGHKSPDEKTIEHLKKILD